MAGPISYYSIIIFFCLTATCLGQAACSAGCLACTRLRRLCTACDVGYSLSSMGLCVGVKGDQRCSLFDNNNKTCLKCEPTYKLLNNSCVKDYSGCLQYNNTQCVNCAFGTTLINGSCNGVLNCLKYNQTCTSCKQGYFYSSNKCFYIKRDCAKVDVGSGACSVCSAGYTLIGFGCQKANSTIAYCELWQGQNCLFCKLGWALYNNTCVLIPECQIDEYLSESYRCQKLPSGCMTADSTGCLKCYPNFLLENATCWQNLPQNCQELTQKGVCNKCTQRYFSYQYVCKKVSAFCGNFDSYGRCLNCSFSYFKFTVGSCNDPNCLNHTVDGCTSCKPKFTVENVTGRCIINDPFCINPTDLVCKQCVNGFYASADICVPLPPSCLNAARDGSCLQCVANYYLQLDQCYETKQNISNCRTYYQYSAKPKCIECEVGYFVVLGNCVQLPPYCTIVLSNGNCVTCINNLQMINGQCTTQQILNCALIQNNKCLRCTAGYVLALNNICYASSNLCISKDQSGVCTQCAGGYLPSRGTCLAAILVDMNCKTYNNTICTQCYLGYYQSNNVCNTPNTNCQNFDPTNGGCTSCFPGYILTNLQCIVMPKIDNCLNYTSKGTCSICQSFFYISNNKCQKVSQLCSGYNSLTGACTSCYLGFTLVNSSCLFLTTALVFNSTMNKTVSIDLCASYSSGSGFCEVCKSGYYLADKKCINYASLATADQNCKVYKTQQECMQCYDGFNLISGVCKAIDPLCQTISPSGGCGSCFEGYTLQSAQCVQLSSQKYDSCLVKANSSCVKCQPGYNLAQGVCVLGSNQSSYSLPYCQIAYNSTHCQLCMNGFYPQNGTCVQVSSYCEQYDPTTGQCLSCKDLYVFSGGSCVFPAMGVDANCITYQGVYCKACKLGYYLKDYVCTKIDAKCLNFNFDLNQCLQCSSGTPLFDVCA